MLKQFCDNLEMNSNERKYTEHICVSKTVKKYTIEDCKDKFIKLNPILKGSHITHNQIQTALIKSYLGIFELKDDK